MVREPIGVAGLGRLGRGIAAALTGFGLRVIAFDTNPEAVIEAKRQIDRAHAEMKAHGFGHLQSCEADGSQLHIAGTLDELASCGFVIESVVESAAAKQNLFAALESLVAPDAVIASNTSALPITQLQKTQKHPERFVGMHWAEPAYATRFLEVIRGELTAQWAVESALELGRAVGKQPCLVNNDLPGFIVNRLGYALYREAAHLLEQGIGDVETIDRAFRNAVGLWAPLCGPFRWMDLTGGPELYARAMKPVLPSLSNTAEVPVCFLQSRDHEGSKEAPRQSFYAYSEGELERWETLLQQQAWEALGLMERYDPLRPVESTAPQDGAVSASSAQSH